MQQICRTFSLSPLAKQKRIVEKLESILSTLDITKKVLINFIVVLFSVFHCLNHKVRIV